MTRSRTLIAFVRRILVWHAVGTGLGTLGFGLGLLLVLFWGSAGTEQLLFGPVYIAPLALMGFVKLTPIAVAVLALWTLSAWRFPALESGSGLRGKALLMVIGCLLVLPIEIGFFAATGAQFRGSSQSGLGLVTPILHQEGGTTFVFAVTALSWFVGPRLLLPSLRPRFAGTRS